MVTNTRTDGVIPSASLTPLTFSSPGKSKRKQSKSAKRDTIDSSSDSEFSPALQAFYNRRRTQDLSLTLPVRTVFSDSNSSTSETTIQSHPPAPLRRHLRFQYPTPEDIAGYTATYQPIGDPVYHEEVSTTEEI